MLNRIRLSCGLFMVAFLSACSGGGGINLPASNSHGAPPPANGTPAAPVPGATANATPSPAPSSAVEPQKHVLTADYIGYGGSSSLSASQVAPYLSWAETNSNSSNALSAAGIKTLDYVDPFRQATTDPLYTSNNSTFSHDCNSDRIAIHYVGGTSNVIQYLMDPGSGSLVDLLNAWERSEENGGHIDAFYFDNVDDLLGVPTAPCHITQGDWDAANASFIKASAHPVVFSGYALSSDAATLIDNSNTEGGVVEDCYSRTSQPTPPYTTGTLWTHNENLELAAAAAGKRFFCYNNGDQGASSSVPLRKYVYASFLLTYSPSSSVLWEDFSTPKSFHVLPETGLVPTSPRVAPSTIVSLQSSSGVYVREYGACYLAGTSLGRCAAIVNSDTSAHRMPSLSASYAHTLTLSGSDVLDGGTAAANGAAPPSTVPAQTGIIAIQ